MQSIVLLTNKTALDKCHQGVLLVNSKCVHKQSFYVYVTHRMLQIYLMVAVPDSLGPYHVKVVI